MISGALSGAWLFILLIATAALLIAISAVAGPAVFAVAALLLPLLLAFQAWLFHIASLATKLQIKEFFVCVGKIFGFHIAIDSAEHFFKSLPKATLKVLNVLAAGYHVYEFLFHCVPKLQGCH